MKRIVALVLVVLMVALQFTVIGCSKKDNNPTPKPDNTDNTQTNNTSTDTENQTIALVKSKYSNYDYNGYAFRVLPIDQGGHMYRLIDESIANEVWYEEDSAESHQHAVFTRNLLANDIIGINVVPVWGGSTTEVPELAKTLIKSGGDDFDMVLSSINKLLTLGAEGYLYNFYDIDSFDMGADWWDQDLISSYTYKKSKLYTITGDYTIFDDYGVPVIFYNKNVLENFNLSDPADLVDAGTWTVEAMMEMANAATQDSSGDGQMTIDDTWGLTDNNHVLTHFLEGCNTHMTIQDDEGVPQVNCSSEDFVNTVQLLFNQIATSPALGCFSNNDCVDMMLEDRALFYYELLGAINSFRDMESVFSLLPLPKKDAGQSNYSSIVNTVWATSLAVPITNSDFSRTGIVMDVLGGLSTDTVNKSLHEVILGPKLFREKRTVSMLSYAVNSKAYDWSKEMSWANTIYAVMLEQYDTQTFTLASALQSKVKVLQKQLKSFLVGMK